MKPNPRMGAPLGCLFCRIDIDDVEAMLDAYDSGMSDISTANCVSQALARRLSCGLRPRLVREGGRCGELEIGGHRIPVPIELLEWLAVAESGGHVEPIEFVLPIPASLAASDSDAAPTSDALLA